MSDSVNLRIPFSKEEKIKDILEKLQQLYLFYAEANNQALDNNRDDDDYNYLNKFKEI